MFDIFKKMEDLGPLMEEMPQKIDDFLAHVKSSFETLIQKHDELGKKIDDLSTQVADLKAAQTSSVQIPTLTGHNMMERTEPTLAAIAQPITQQAAIEAVSKKPDIIFVK